MGRDDMRGEPRGRRGRPRLRTGLGALAVAAVAAVAMPAMAQAAPVTVSSTGPGGVVTITGTEQPDDFWVTHRISNDPNWLDVESDSDGTPILGAGCFAMPEELSYAKAVRCPRPSRIDVALHGGDDYFSADTVNAIPVTIPVVVDGGAGNDVINASAGDSTLHGGPGDDTLRGDVGSDVLHGGDGNDTLLGRAGNDTLYGDAGNDELLGEEGNDILNGGAGDDNLDGSHMSVSNAQAGADTYIGGPGYDRFSYFMRFAAISATLDGVANDGEPGEGDNIHPDVEEIGGGWGDDILIGSDGDNVLWGSSGNDTIRGLGGNDKLYGDDGADLVDGGPGNDEIKGGCHDDRLIGGPGVDTLISDDCTDFLKRGTMDRLEANDGERDAMIFCSLSHEAPADIAIVDPIDPVTNTGAGACGTIQIVTAMGGGGAPTTLTGKVSLRFGKYATLLTGAGKVKKNQAAKRQLRLKGKTRTLTLGTLRATSAKVKVTAVATFRKGKTTVPLGKKTLAVTKATPKTLTIRVPAKGAKAVGKAKRVKAKVAFTVRNARGKVVKKSTKTFPVAVVRR